MEGSQNQNWLSRKFFELKDWIRTHKIAAAMIAVVLLMIISGLTAWAVLFNPEVKFSNPLARGKELPIAEKRYYSPLTGRHVKNEAITKRQVTGIMIENSPESRPQSGMRSAGVIYEAIAEAGITRFLAIYQEDKPGLVGPVRSLRPYYVDWLAPYDAAYAHVGGSFKALQTVRNGKYKDIDQFFNPSGYYRSQDRYAPHNVYTTFAMLDKVNKSKGFKSSTFTGFKRKTAAPAVKPSANKINVDISSGTYNSSYSYDKVANHYVRSQDGAPHIDRESKRALTPKVVIVIKVKMVLGFEDGYREQIQTNGTGQAFIFQDGTVQQVNWHKKNTKSSLRFETKEGKPVKLNVGQTWIAAIPSDRNVTWQ